MSSTRMGRINEELQQPDLPGGKNRFRAELVQEITGVVFNCYSDKWTGEEELLCLYPAENTEQEREIPLFRWQDGELIRVEPFLPMRWRKIGWYEGVDYYDLGQGRVVAVGWDSIQKGSARLMYEVGIVADSAGLLKCPVRFEANGSVLQSTDIYSMPDGGVLVWYVPCGCRDHYELVRYAPDGSIVWSKSVESEKVYPFLFRDGLLWFWERDREKDPYYALDENGDEVCHLELPPFPDDKRYVYEDTMLCDQPVAGELWVERKQSKRRGYKRTYTLFHLDTRGRLLGQHPVPCEVSDFPGFRWRNMALWPGRICLASLDEGIWMLDAKDFSVLAAVEACRGYSYVTFDGRGRVWVEVDGDWECYDQNLNLLSRHRLKGDVKQVASQRKGDGTLRLLTYDYKEHTLRVYAMKEK